MKTVGLVLASLFLVVGCDDKKAVMPEPVAAVPAAAEPPVVEAAPAVVAPASEVAPTPAVAPEVK